MTKYLLIIFLILNSCCPDSVELSKFILTDSEKESIPYITDQTVSFIHSNGFKFDLYIINKNTEFRQTVREHCGDSFSTYEILTSELMSSIPELNINLEITPFEFDTHLWISVNQQDFYININQAPYFDKLTINGKEFYNVYKTDVPIIDSTIIKPKQLLYNKETGIIQISMTNNETYTINK